VTNQTFNLDRKTCSDLVLVFWIGLSLVE